MTRRRTKRTHSDSVELNLAAMLDMAFQLLTFFILTFKPAPIEGQISLRMPPPLPPAATPEGRTAGSETTSVDVLAGLTTLVVSVTADKHGEIGSLAIGRDGSSFTVSTIARLSEHLKTSLSGTDSPVRQLLIQAGSSVNYDALMSVVDICSRQRLSSGEKLTRLSFVEVPDGT